MKTMKTKNTNSIGYARVRERTRSVKVTYFVRITHIGGEGAGSEEKGKETRREKKKRKEKRREKKEIEDRNRG